MGAQDAADGDRQSARLTLRPSTHSDELPYATRTLSHMRISVFSQMYIPLPPRRPTDCCSNTRTHGRVLYKEASTHHRAGLACTSL